VRSAAQQPPRIALATLPAEWRALSQSQRDQWDAYAANSAQEKTDVFGDPYYVSGWNWFVSVNQWRATVGQSVASVPPSSATPAAPTITALTVDEDPADTSSITFSGAPFSSAYGVVFLAFAAANSALAMPAARALLALTVASGSGASSFSFADLQSVFGVLQEDQSAYAWAYTQTTDGRRGAPYTFRDLVVST